MTIRYLVVVGVTGIDQVPICCVVRGGAVQSVGPGRNAAAITMVGIRKVFGKFQQHSEAAPIVLEEVKCPKVAKAQKSALRILENDKSP